MATDVDALARTVEAHEVTLYRGNGKPGLVTRMALLEDSQGRWERIAWVLLTAAVFSLVAAIVNHWWR